MKKKDIERISQTCYRSPENLTNAEREFVTKKYFGIGLGKTGTNSITEAMRILGFVSTHGIRYVDAIHKNQFASDISISWRYKFLDYAFPAAKFILTTRSLRPWLKSCENHRKVGGKDDVFFQDVPLVKGRLRKSQNRFMLFGITYYDRDIYTEVYHKFHYKVVEHFKGREDKLLILDICGGGEGWEKLCPFVGKPIPDIPFPHQNRTIYQDG
ncbi:MAG: sulfotransferase [Planctomycetota bacterium]|jgi:hypothetical protein